MNRALTRGAETMRPETTSARRSRRLARLGTLAGAATLLMGILGMGQASAASQEIGPLYTAKAVWGDTNLPPGGNGQFTIQLRNIGDVTEETEELVVTDQLPDGVTITGLKWEGFFDLSFFCTGVGTSTATCNVPGFALPFILEAPGFAPEAFYAKPHGFAPLIVLEVAIDPAASGTGTNRVTLTGGGAPDAEDVDQVPFSATPSSFGLVRGSYEADIFDKAAPFGDPSRTAGDHPFEQRAKFDMNATGTTEIQGIPVITSHDLAKTIEVTLPRGMSGNPEATPKCDPADFAEFGAVGNSTACPADTQIGYADVSAAPIEYAPNANGFLSRVAVYNLEPPKGVPADFGLNAGGIIQAHIYPELDPSQNYAIKTVVPNITSLETLRGGEITIWGVPGDPAHDKFRAYPKQTDGKALGAPWGSAPIRPLLTNPMDCGFDNGGARVRAESYNHPGDFTPVEEYPHPLNVNGCDDPRFRFEPEISLDPSDRHAGAPTGLDVHLEVPQRNDEVNDAKELYAANGFVKGVSTPPIKKAVVTFPEGMTLSPSAAQGLGSCSSAQISLGTNQPVRCPDNSQYGKLIIHTPILPVDAQPEGFIYIAKQNDNPFHSFLAIYLVIEEQERGILVKVPGRIDLDSGTGQIKTTFDDLPQFPVSDMQLSLKGGVRAGLVNPSTCGTKTIEASFFTWQDPATPRKVKSSYEITQKPDGSPCATNLADRQFKPGLEGGTLSPTAGSFSPFVFRLTRSDDDQEFSQLNVSLPKGLVAKLAGVTQCSDAAIAQAETPGRSGVEEQSSPSCPDSSYIGTTEVGAGVGVPLTYVSGKVYLAGPYKGAPLSMVVVTPAVVGPYDLGVIAVRSALRVNPRTAEVSVASDPFPLIFKGIPVRIRDIRVRTDKSNFTINPTSCDPTALTAHLTGTGGNLLSTSDDTGADLSTRFQAASCASLAFKPRLNLRLFGGIHRGAHPRLRAVLRGRAGDANISWASVTMPHSEFLDQAHIRTVCTRVQFAADQCPAGSIYGQAVARSPLLDEPLSGPVYLRSSSHKLPDMVVSLSGLIDVELAGRVDSVNGRIRNTFEVVPDAPVSSFVLNLQGGRKGLLQNSRNICKGAPRATVRFRSQSGRALVLHPKLAANSCKQAKRKHRRAHAKHRPR